MQMRMVAGAVLIMAAEQAFAHSLMVRFPNHLFAREVLLPSSAVLLALGLAFLVWGTLTEFQRRTPSDSNAQPDSKSAV
jgi:uncharacterized membrane protein